MTKSKMNSQQVYEMVSTMLGDLRAQITEPIRIKEEELTEQLGVSRTPVREALIRLDSIGMIELRPGRGALITPVSDQDYFDWLQIREQLEGLAAREASLNASKRDANNLKAIFEDFIGKDLSQIDDVKYSEANAFFHKEVFRLANNSLLERVWDSYGHRQTSYGNRTIAKLHRTDDSLKEHLKIVEAISEQNAELAEKLARNHVKALHLAVKNHLHNHS